ncbi:hypothetical protein EDD16DRAFT_1523364 [Pisolithus croceorrhizus]|nr:hypothetical protein EDD16DRAFT_1523364 [Pisolithus croceorrhizus]KAI6143154.1 hypothetical protein EDD17DRAFT_1515618 [Pisolithus thermaeus]
MNGLKTTSINLIINDVNCENSDTSKRKEDEVARHDDVDDHADDYSDDQQLSFKTMMPAFQQNSSQILIPLTHVSSHQPGSLFPNHNQVCTSTQSSQLQLPPPAWACHPSQLPAPSGGCPQLHAPIHSHLSWHQGAQPSRPHLPSQASLPHSSVQNILPHLHPNQTWVQALQMVTGMTIVKLIVQEMKDYLSTISLPKLKKQCTSTEDKLSLEEDNSEVTPGTPKLTGQGCHTKYLKNPKVHVLFKGYYPWYKLDMAKLLSISSSPSKCHNQGRPLQSNQNQGRRDSERECICISEESKSVKSLHQFAKFQQYVPYKALLLVAAIVRVLPFSSCSLR